MNGADVTAAISRPRPKFAIVKFAKSLQLNSCTFTYSIRGPRDRLRYDYVSNYEMRVQALRGPV